MPNHLKYSDLRERSPAKWAFLEALGTGPFPVGFLDRVAKDGCQVSLVVDGVEFDFVKVVEEWHSQYEEHLVVTARGMLSEDVERARGVLARFADELDYARTELFKKD